MLYFILLILVLNILWFGAAFHLFSIKSTHAAKMLLARDKRIAPYNSIVSQLFKFLGGFNLSLFLLSIITILNHQQLIATQLGAAIFLVFFIAHGSQFWYNIPLALKERNKEIPIWPVLRGRMYFIFKTDFFLAICNLIISGYLFVI